jgi:hypothetical protein
VTLIDIPVFDTPRASHGGYRLHMRGDKGCLLLTPGLTYPLARAALMERSKAFAAAGWTVERFEEVFSPQAPPTCVAELTRPAEWGGTLVLELRVLGGHE